MPREVLVIGGTLFIGPELVRRLLARGDRVTILHRGRSPIPREADEILCDRNDVAAVRRALAGRRFDLVYDNVYDWARGTTAEPVLAAAEAVAPARYVFMSSVAAYGNGLDHDEGDPLDVTAAFPYIQHKATAEERLLASGLPVITLRPPFIYGSENPFYREAFFWDRLTRDRPIIIPDDGSRLMQFVFVRDLVWAMLRVAEPDIPTPRAYNLGDPAPVTQLEAVQAFARAAGREPRLVFVPRAVIESAGGKVFEPPFYFGEYFDLPPITMRIDRARRELGFSPTPFEAGLAQTYQWYLNQDRPTPDFSFDERLTRLPPAPHNGV
jgi:nucleoside-diphosphate-sugar epimerase